MLTFNSIIIARPKKCASAIFCLTVLAVVWQNTFAQATLEKEKARDSSLKKSESPKVQKLPDLVVTSIQYSGNRAAVAVHNKGIETSAPCRLFFRVVGEEQWTVNIPALIPKGFVYTADIYRGKPFAGKGIAKIDSENQVTESNENNNTLTIDKPAVVPDIAAIELSFKDEYGATQIVGKVQNVSNVNLIASDVRVRLIRITLYGAHQNVLEFKTQDVTSLNAGAIYEVKAPMPKPFPGADSYIWILRVDGDANDANNNVEKKSAKIDNN